MSHEHDWHDDDTITVRELRGAFDRLSKIKVDVFLDDISKHREPEYPVGTVWEDRIGTYWFRVADSKWTRFGNAEMFSDRVPTRPLVQLKVAE